MRINITSSEFAKDSINEEFIRILETNQPELHLEEATIYSEFPIYRDNEGIVEYPSFMMVSPYHGIILFQCDGRTQRTLSESNLAVLCARVEQASSYVFSKLIRVPLLKVKGASHQLVVPIYSMLYLPSYLPSAKPMEDYEGIPVATSAADLRSFLLHKQIEPLSKEIIDCVFSVVEGTKGLPNPKARGLLEKRGIKGQLLDDLEKEIARFDKQQEIAALSQIEGPQRIRGLAGSGKTVVLAMKAALIHLKNPSARILYTFWTKSLYDHVRQLITRFYRIHEDHDPDWNMLHIRHAWGGKSLPGVYFDTCRANSLHPMTLVDAKSGAGDPFDFVCRKLFEVTGGKLQKTYDYVLMDEGQDFHASFYWLCRAIVKNDCLVWAYDELQNILHVKIQDTETLFRNSYGYEGINLAALQESHPRQHNDIVLYRCYRNPREILVFAHAVGFGIYNHRIVQRLENKAHWHDIGYVVEQGDCIKGQETVIVRPPENSPSSISNRQKIEELIVWYSAEDLDDEVEWVSQSIKGDIDLGLLPEDIMIVCLDDRNAKTYFSRLGKKLATIGILSYNVLESYKGDDFCLPDCVTLTTVYRAKGNEASTVYVVGVDVFSKQERDDITQRNKLFTAFTRAKAWLRISGVSLPEFLLTEMDMARSNVPSLCFTYPGEDDIVTLRRELAEANQERNEKLRKLMDALEDLGLSQSDALSLLRAGGKQSER